MTSMTTPSEYSVGERFRPTGVELINHFLKQKLLGNDQLVSRIPLLDLYQFDPWNLYYSDDGEGYFFSPLHPKYPGSKNRRINRSTGTGTWLAKGKDYEIKSEFTGEVIGIRRIFVHSCEKDGIKYVMHEYSIPNQSSLVLCKVMKKMPSKKSEGPCKKVKKRKEAADLPLPCNEDHSTPVPDEDQHTEKSTCDNGGTNRQQTSSASVDVDAYYTTPEDQVDPETLQHLQSLSGYDQQDYCSVDDFITLDDQQDYCSVDDFITLDDLPWMLPEQM
uniref:NAC domain-containing protein n=1 Tax=Salix viminalis TaxID=40686 RepID=A0A6N2KZ76_SALVM